MALSLRVAFLHPDLGIGGAERLVVDAALALQKSGHIVDIYTSHHDRSHCFEETRNGQLNVIVIGDHLPRHILGKGAIVFASWRSLAAACWMVRNYGKPVSGPIQRRVFNGTYDVIFVDQLSISIPLFAATPAKVLFYGHFPDLLLAHRGSLMKRLYRIPFDWLEELTTGYSDKIVVNSAFTRTQFFKTFPSFLRAETTLDVLYPSINFANYETNEDYRIKRAEAITNSWSRIWRQWDSKDATKAIAKEVKNADVIDRIPASTAVFVSINRFERKKNIGLAISALAQLKRKLSTTRASGAIYGYTECKLIIAGGYDYRVLENVEYYQELQDFATKQDLGFCQYPSLDQDVIFLRSFSQAQRSALLRRAQAVVYTPENEHFGIVPVEAMYSGVPVIACASGGPLESIKANGETGYLCEPSSDAFAHAMIQIMNMSLIGPPSSGSKSLDAWLKSELELADRARKHVISMFSEELFRLQLDTHIKNTFADRVRASPHAQRIQRLRQRCLKLGDTPAARLNNILLVLKLIVIVVVLFVVYRAIRCIV